MGKSRGKGKKRKNGDNSTPPSKRRRQIFSYWIETSGSSEPYNRKDIVKNANITIEVTRCELIDDLLLSNPELTEGVSQNFEQCHEVPVKLNDITGDKAITNKEKLIIEKIDPLVPEAEDLEADKTEALLSIPKPKIQVVRCPSAIGKIKKKKNGYTDLPNGDCGDGVVNPHSESGVLDKYWAQRRRLFSRFDEGIQMDSQGWYSTTPEVIADHTANRSIRMGKTYFSNKRSDLIILDAFCGCGGNAIAFAKNKDISLVIAVDNDLQKIEMAKHNAKIYGIPKNKIIFLVADAIEVINCYSNGSICPDAQLSRIIKEAELPDCIDIIFISPPWGGPEYLRKNTFNFAFDTKIESSVDNENCKNGHYLLKAAVKSSRNKMVILFLPRNTNGNKLGRTAYDVGYEDGSIVEMEENVVNGKLKAITVFFFQKPYCS